VGDSLGPNKRYGKWDVEEFLESGEHQIEDALQHGKKLGFPLSFESALDFGCGVGRLTRALAGRFKTCVGVDISPAMIQQARRLNADRPGCTFVLNTTDDLAFASTAASISSTATSCSSTSPRIQRSGDTSRVRSSAAARWPACLSAAVSHSAASQISTPPKAVRRISVSARAQSIPVRASGLYPIRMSSLPESEVVQLLEGEGAKVLEVERSIAGTA